MLRYRRQRQTQRHGASTTPPNPEPEPFRTRRSVTVAASRALLAAAATTVTAVTTATAGQKATAAPDPTGLTTVKGYKAAESAFAPGKKLYAPPLLPQSALLNSLPLRNDALVAELQAYLESFVQLINPSDRQVDQIKSNTSALWYNLRINAQRAAGMFLYNRDGLKPYANDGVADTLQEARADLADRYLDQMQQDVLRLVNASRKSSVSESLRCMRRSLNMLCNVANLFVPLNATTDGRVADNATQDDDDDDVDDDDDDDDDREKNGQGKGKGTSVATKNVRKRQGTLLLSKPPPDYKSLPRLLGRATVVLSFQRPGPDRIVPLPSPAGTGSAAAAAAVADDVSLVTIVVDGINYPLTGGSFVDLVQRGYYDALPVSNVPYEFDGDSIARTVFGSDKAPPYVDPLTGLPRRLPLEVLRDVRTVPTATTTNATVLPASAAKALGDASTVRYTATGLARNSAVYTKGAQPVLSFATYGSIGMMPSIGDGFGDSLVSNVGSFFWVPPDRSLRVTEREALPAMRRLSGRCSLFAHVVEGNDVLELLRPGDVLLTAEVKDEEGSWRLQRPPPDSFRDNDDDE